jgi:hypothetical protein
LSSKLKISEKYFGNEPINAHIMGTLLYNEKLS